MQFPTYLLGSSPQSCCSRGFWHCFLLSPVFHKDYAFIKIKDKFLGLVYNSVIVTDSSQPEEVLSVLQQQEQGFANTLITG